MIFDWKLNDWICCFLYIYMCSIPLGRWSAGFSTWIFTRCLNINFIFFIVFFLRCFSNLRFLAYSCRLALASESNDMWLIRRQRCVGQVTEKWELARSLLNYINSNLYYSTFYYQTRLVSSLMDFIFCSHSFRSDFFLIVWFSLSLIGIIICSDIAWTSRSHDTNGQYTSLVSSNKFGSGRVRRYSISSLCTAHRRYQIHFLCELHRSAGVRTERERETGRDGTTNNDQSSSGSERKKY